MKCQYIALKVLNAMDNEKEIRIVERIVDEHHKSSSFIQRYKGILHQVQSSIASFFEIYGKENSKGPHDCGYDNIIGCTFGWRCMLCSPFYRNDDSGRSCYTYRPGSAVHA